MRSKRAASLNARVAAQGARLILCVALVASFGSCVQRRDRVTISVAGVPFSVEVARTEAERERGLMFRKTIGDREGMLFVFDRDEHLTFWMKDTTLPLSIAFISEEGRILQIEDMQPLSLEVIRSELSARYALEVKQGAFDEVGAKVGDSVSLPPQAR